jgi:hypothetical protein
MSFAGLKGAGSKLQQLLMRKCSRPCGTNRRISPPKALESVGGQTSCFGDRPMSEMAQVTGVAQAAQDSCGLSSREA